MNLEKKYMKYTAFIMFSLIVILSIYILSIGWNNPLLDKLPFRQAQTAISTYYFVHNPDLNIDDILHYETPVLGAPWSIPFEFPVYQVAVYAAVKTLNIHLDQAGRLISIFFYIIFLISTYILIRLFFKRLSSSLSLLSLCLLNPVHLFWSRTFMIESTAAAFGMIFLVANIYLSIKAKKERNKVYLITIYFVALFSGILCSLTKSTTFIVYGFAVGIFWLYTFRKDIKRKNYHDIIKYFLYLIPLFITIFVIAIWWINFSDSIKIENIFAKDFITSEALKQWNFGTLSQRVDVFLKGGIIKNRYRAFMLLIGFVFLFIEKKQRTLMIMALSVYLIGPLLLTNLYDVHTYYWYANSVFLVIFAGIGPVSLLDKYNQKKWYGMLLLIALLGMFSLYQYKDKYYHDQKKEQQIPEVALKIKEMTMEDDVVFYIGQDWSSILPYYSERRAVMDRWGLNVDSKKFLDTIKNLGNKEIEALVVPIELSNTVDQFIEYFNFCKRYRTSDYFYIYTKS